MAQSWLWGSQIAVNIYIYIYTYIYIYILFKCHGSILFLSFNVVVKKLVITTNLVVKIQNPVMNHELRPIKLSPIYNIYVQLV